MKFIDNSYFLYSDFNDILNNLTEGGGHQGGQRS